MKRWSQRAWRNKDKTGSRVTFRNGGCLRGGLKVGLLIEKMCAHSIEVLHRKMRKDFHPKHRKRSSAEQSPSDPPQQNPMVPRPQRILDHWKPVTILRNYQKSSNISSHLVKLLSFLKPIVLVIANLPNSPRPLKVVLSETAIRDLLMKSASISVAPTRAFIFMSTTPWTIDINWQRLATPAVLL